MNYDGSIITRSTSKGPTGPRCGLCEPWAAIAFYIWTQKECGDLVSRLYVLHKFLRFTYHVLHRHKTKKQHYVVWTQRGVMKPTFFVIFTPENDLPILAG